MYKKIECGVLLWTFSFLATFEARTVRWYCSMESSQNLDFDVSFAKMHPDVITGWYPLEGQAWQGLVFYPNGTFKGPSAANYSKYRQYVQTLRYAIPGRTLSVHAVTGNVHAEFIMSSRSLLVIPGIVQHVKQAGLDGYLIDFEPQHTGYHSKDLARNFSKFIHSLGKAMHSEGLEIGIDVANFGPISVHQFFFLRYAIGTDVDFFTSMTPTYYGTNVTDDKIFAEQLKEMTGEARARIGVGSMPAAGTGETCDYNYNWTESKFNDFTTYLKSKNFSHLDIWPRCVSDEETAPWFLQAISNFLKD